MALDFQNTQIQTSGISSNTVLAGVTTVTTLNASNAIVSGVVTATGGVVANVTGNVTGNLTGNINGNFTASGTATINGDVATGGRVTLTGQPFFRNLPIIANNYTVTSTYNELSIGPITINTGITVTVDSGATWTVV